MRFSLPRAVGGRSGGGLTRTNTSKWTSREKWMNGDAGAGATRRPTSQASLGEALRGARFQLEKCLRELERAGNRVHRHPITARLIADQRDDLIAVSRIVNAVDPRRIRGQCRGEERD